MNRFLFCCLLAPSTLRAAEDFTFFEQKVRPVLVEHCYGCHSAEAKKLKGNLFLDSKAGWQKGGDSGEAVIIPGKPEESLLIRSIQHLEADLEMPPKKPKLADAVIADLVNWVRMGARDPRDGGKVEAKRGDKNWWSLQPLAKVEAGRTIDDFIEAKLREQGLTLNPEADPRTLIRRATYDITGLPPTPGEVEAFVDKSHPSHESYEQLVDRLLASPHYGEQWGRHWMDVIRFGESNGFERNFNLDDVWPFRDFIIGSLNLDKPFNQFITEHLAGDVIANGNPFISLATAFLVCGPYDDVKNLDEKAVKEIRAVTLDDMITATGSAFLGLTINCARCHNHKFDPIPTEDYYRIRAAFEGVTHGRREVVSAAERAKFDAAVKPLNERKASLAQEREALQKAIDERAAKMLAQRKFTKPKLTYEFNEERFEPVKARHVKFTMSAHSENPRSAVGARMDEFEVWSAGADSRNVALATNGGKAEGKHERESAAENSERSYGASLVIDGGLGTRWFIAEPAELTITLAEEEWIDRISFSNAREGRVERLYAQGALPVEYQLEVSRDGETWSKILDSSEREPWSREHGIERMRRETITQAEQAQLAKLRGDIAEVEAKLKAVPPLRQVWAGLFAEPQDKTFVQLGGDPSRPAAQAFPASLEVLDRTMKPFALPADAPEGERRLALAKWITGDDNALALRVLANRVWHYHFGTGLVDTPGDFGFLGSKPTHPELLDCLATRLRDHGWKIKALHREIMMSKAYRQSSASHAEAAKLDKDARLLWRFPPRRLMAEEVRDTVLSVSGKLDLRRGGPPFRLFTYTADNVWTYHMIERPGAETYRRTVYHQNIRAINVPVIGDFDFPDIVFPVPKRANTTSPMQAFTMLNNGFMLDMADALAARVSSANDDEAQVRQLYRHLLQRSPSSSEVTRAKTMMSQHGLPALCRALLNLNELLYLE